MNSSILPDLWNNVFKQISELGLAAFYKEHPVNNHFPLYTLWLMSSTYKRIKTTPRNNRHCNSYISNFHHKFYISPKIKNEITIFPTKRSKKLCSFLCFINMIFSGECCKKIPFRVWIAVMVFLTTYVNYTTRVNISISIVSMTGGKEKTEPECLKKESNVTLLEIDTATTTKKPLPDVSNLFKIKINDLWRIFFFRQNTFVRVKQYFLWFQLLCVFHNFKCTIFTNSLFVISE